MTEDERGDCMDIRHKLDDYKRDEDGAFLDGDDCWHDDAESLIQCGLLGFCGCGTPDDNLNYIRLGLELIDAPRPSGPSAEWHAWWSQHSAQCKSHFGNDKAMYFFYYWCDKEGLTEHGGSVPGWLTGKGRRLLALLCEWEKLGENDRG